MTETAEVILTISTSIILLVIGFIVGRWRDKDKQIFNKKLEIYSNIINEISTERFLFHNIKLEFNHTLRVDEINLSKKIEKNKYDIRRKFDKTHNHNRLIMLLAPARLIGSRKVVKEVREYHSLISEYLEIKDRKKYDIHLKKITVCAMKLEQLMRQDLLGFLHRDLYDSDIKAHVKSKSNGTEG